MAASASASARQSPWEMAVETEQWLVNGAGARFLPGMEGPARDVESFVFVDETWPSAFQERIGKPVFLRVSPITGCCDFEDADGSAFWTIVPYAPLTWNWISPFRSPLCPDTQNLYSTFRLVRDFQGEELAQIRAYANGFKEQIKAINIQRALINEEQRTNDCDYVIPESATAPGSPDGSYVVGEINGSYEKLPA